MFLIIKNYIDNNMLEVFGKIFIHNSYVCVKHLNECDTYLRYMNCIIISSVLEIKFLTNYCKLSALCKCDMFLIWL